MAAQSLRLNKEKSFKMINHSILRNGEYMIWPGFTNLTEIKRLFLGKGIKEKHRYYVIISTNCHYRFSELDSPADLGA